MINILWGMGLLFLAIAFIVTEGNAKYILAGYNTLSQAQRKNFNLKGYISFFKKFHIFLAASLVGVGLLLHHYMGPQTSGLFLGTYPLLAYLFFIGYSQRYSVGPLKKTKRISLFLMAVVLIFVIVLFKFALRDDAIRVEGKTIMVEGFYGETLGKTDIAEIVLISDLPTITLRTNGFSLGEIRKGYFKTENGETVKLILNSSQPNTILLTKKSGEKLYYSAKDEKNEKVYEWLVKSL